MEFLLFAIQLKFTKRIQFQEIFIYLTNYLFQKLKKNCSQNFNYIFKKCNKILDKN